MTIVCYFVRDSYFHSVDDAPYKVADESVNIFSHGINHWNLLWFRTDVSAGLTLESCKANSTAGSKSELPLLNASRSDETWLAIILCLFQSFGQAASNIKTEMKHFRWNSFRAHNQYIYVADESYVHCSGQWAILSVEHKMFTVT